MSLAQTTFWCSLIASILSLAACSSDPSTKSDTTPAEVQSTDVATELTAPDQAAASDTTNEVADDTTSALEDSTWEDETYCPAMPSPCAAGEIMCKYANTAFATCSCDPDPDLPYSDCTRCFWSEVEACPVRSKCQDGIGCVCLHGSCTDNDDLEQVCEWKEAAPDTTVESWTCKEGCCFNSNFCEKASNCLDCLNLETGEKLQPCPQPPPEGFILNGCTLDVCIVAHGVCQWTDKVEEGLCDDGTECTVDSCDPVTGDCTYEMPGQGPDCPCCHGVCWGATQEAATAMCGATNCVWSECSFDDGFNPWTEIYYPDEVVNDEFIGLCIYTDVVEAGSCEDLNPCTKDTCDDEIEGGCANQPDDSLPCDDGDPETTNACSDGECVVVTQ